MHPKCRQAVQQAAGRALTDSEIQKIDDAMSANMRRLARQDPSGWAAKSADQRVLEAAAAGMQDIQAAAALKVQRAQLQILRTASMETRVGDLMASYAIRQAQLTTHRGAEFLTPEAIRASGSPEADRVVAKVLGLITDESEYAVLNPDLATRVMSSGGGEQRGTMRGELARSVMQFKSFPIAMVSRHWRRMLDTPQGLDGAPVAANRVAYAGALFASLGALGAIAYQTKQIVSGKDPADMTRPKFWVKAIAQGGVLSIMGDILLADSTEEAGQYASKTISGLAGPTIGAAADLSLKVIKGNIDKAAAGKETHAAAEAITLARSHLPYVNLWYAKAALDHAGMHALQENLSPGYLSRMQQRAHKEWGQDFWWKPGTGGPDRAPDFTAIGGK